MTASLPGAREGWEAAYAEMAARGDDELPMDGTTTTCFDVEEWDWLSVSR